MKRWCGYVVRSAAESPVAVTAAPTSGATAAASAAADEFVKPSPMSKPDMLENSCGSAVGASSGLHASGGGVQLSPGGVAYRTELDVEMRGGGGRIGNVFRCSEVFLNFCMGAVCKRIHTHTSNNQGPDTILAGTTAVRNASKQAALGECSDDTIEHSYVS